MKDTTDLLAQRLLDRLANGTPLAMSSGDGTLGGTIDGRVQQLRREAAVVRPGSCNWSGWGN